MQFGFAEEGVEDKEGGPVGADAQIQGGGADVGGAHGIGGAGRLSGGADGGDKGVIVGDGQTVDDDGVDIIYSEAFDIPLVSDVR